MKTFQFQWSSFKNFSESLDWMVIHWDAESGILMGQTLNAEPCTVYCDGLFYDYDGCDYSLLSLSITETRNVSQDAFISFWFVYFSLHPEGPDKDILLITGCKYMGV